jgi:hypothetical protein
MQALGKLNPIRLFDWKNPKDSISVGPFLMN